MSLFPPGSEKLQFCLGYTTKLREKDPGTHKGTAVLLALWLERKGKKFTGNNVSSRIEISIYAFIYDVGADQMKNTLLKQIKSNTKILSFFLK